MGILQAPSNRKNCTLAIGGPTLPRALTGMAGRRPPAARGLPPPLCSAGKKSPAAAPGPTSLPAALPRPRPVDLRMPFRLRPLITCLLLRSCRFRPGEQMPPGLLDTFLEALHRTERDPAASRAQIDYRQARRSEPLQRLFADLHPSVLTAPLSEEAWQEIVDWEALLAEQAGQVERRRRRRPTSRRTFSPPEALCRLAAGGPGPLRLIYCDPDSPSLQRPERLGQRLLPGSRRLPQPQLKARLLRLGWQPRDPQHLELLQLSHVDWRAKDGTLVRGEIMARFQQRPAAPGGKAAQLWGEWHLQPREPAALWDWRVAKQALHGWHAAPVSGGVWPLGRVLWADADLLILEQGSRQGQPLRAVYHRDCRAQDLLQAYFRRRWLAKETREVAAPP